MTAALKEKHKANVVVVNTRAEALAAALAAIPKGASISAAGSHTLTLIGYDEWAKKQTDHKDYKVRGGKKRKTSARSMSSGGFVMVLTSSFTGRVVGSVRQARKRRH